MMPLVLRGFFVVVCACIGACATRGEPAPFSVDALVADAPAYVASRYHRGELPGALIADLAAEEFQCNQTLTECGGARHAFGSCWDVVTVHISDDTVRAEKNRRCMGAQP